MTIVTNNKYTAYNGYFCRVPKNFIISSANDKLLLSIVYLDRNRTYENNVGLSFNSLISYFGYSVHRGNNKVTKEFKDKITFLLDNGLVELHTDKFPYKLSEYFSLSVINDFNLQNGYVVLTAHEIDTLLSFPYDTAKVFFLYLYIKSFIYQKNRNSNNQNCEADKKSNYISGNELKPSAFFSDIRSIAPDTRLSNKFVDKCVDLFIDKGLLIKKEVGSYYNKSGKRVNAPNIYVENNEYAQDEIELALNRLKYSCKTDDFLPMMRKIKKKNKGEA